VVALGIAPWGLVHNRQQLVNPQVMHAIVSNQTANSDISFSHCLFQHSLRNYGENDGGYLGLALLSFIFLFNLYLTR
jgi:hypothetical protein